MTIKGFQGTSLLDFPGRIASLIFYGGCNLSCPFCHNPALVIDPFELPDYPTEAILEELYTRRTFIDGVVISGGEPTLAAGLPDLLEEIRRLGLQTKLDTNGLAPTVLGDLLARQLLDYVALDVKTAPQRYGELHDSPIDLDLLPRSIALLKNSGVDHEFRTTCVPGFVEVDDIHAMGEILNGGRRWILQQFMSAYSLDSSLREIAPHAPETLTDLAAIGRHYVDEVALRGV